MSTTEATVLTVDIKALAELVVSTYERGQQIAATLNRLPVPIRDAILSGIDDPSRDTACLLAAWATMRGKSVADYEALEADGVDAIDIVLSECRSVIDGTAQVEYA